MPLIYEYTLDLEFLIRETIRSLINIKLLTSVSLNFVVNTVVIYVVLCSLRNFMKKTLDSLVDRSGCHENKKKKCTVQGPMLVFR